ncbi:DNA-binding protein [Amycolatopsis vancoresmycina]|uniref:Helix-turn-helix domain-containing protein n=1 Tax=Amycolatopsis vancoresmycina DSM 44592 TaxID=1292037 RepID=R1G2C0_9PSEU|nr:DNA-binding protein [Amycolatopsis vancoresmycina]EOD65617.1 hypothetical protein H480_25825 [Amycolatopsis vancoresmycina DSM 44592]
MAAAQLSEIKTWPSTVDVATAASALGISKSYGYALAARGEFPCRVLAVGTRYRVVTASLVALLEEPGDTPPAA